MPTSGGAADASDKHRNRAGPGRLQTRGIMKAQSQSHRPKEKLPKGRRGARAAGDEMNQATGDEFEREGLGIAPKE